MIGQTRERHTDTGSGGQATRRSSDGPRRPGRDGIPRTRVEAVDRLVEHLDRRHGHAVLTGPLGFGLGSAMHACVDELSAYGRLAHVVRLHVMTGEEPARWPDLGPDDVLVLDARHARDVGVVDEAVRQAAVHGAQLLLVSTWPTAPSADPDGASMEAVMRAHGAGVFVLRPWSEHEIHDVLRHHEADGWDAAEVAELTGGLPWLVRHLCDRLEDDPGAGPDVPTSDRVGAYVLGLLDSADRRVTDTALALAVGYPLSGRPPLPGTADDEVGGQDGLLRLVEACGLIGADGGLPPLVRDALLRHAPSHWVERTRVRLVDDIVEEGEDLAAFAPDLVRQGVTDHRVAEALVARVHADLTSSRRAQAQELADLLRVALDAGVHVGQMRLELARLALCQGDLDTATRELDRLLAEGGEPPEGLLAVGLEVAAAMDLPHLADTIVALVQDDDGCALTDHPGVVLRRYATGDVEGAARAMTPEQERGPASAASLFVRGVRSTVTGRPAAALPQLMQAAAASVPSAMCTDAPCAYVALWGLHAGDLHLVDTTVAAATRETSTPPLLRSRLGVLGAWSAMAAGRLDEAADLIDGLGPVSPRDQFWICALRTGLARRLDDYAALRAEWRRAREVVLSHPVGLWQLLPLGELGLAAARVRDFDVIRPLWDRAAELLTELGEPALWASPFHWYAVQVALQRDDPGAVAPHAAALVGASREWPLAAVLSSAGRSWVRVRARDVDPDDVERSARDLGRAGLPWEGARLAAHGAAAAAARRDRDRLNECAREVLPRVVPTGTLTHPRGPEATSGGAESAATSGLQLTAREWQVAELVVAGRTYKQIGEVLYLSPKTVEHHVARIRRRSGVASRAELLELLLATVGHHDGSF